MFANTKTISLEGIKPIEIEVQVHSASGLPGLNIVGLANRAVSESKERIRAALSAIGLALPPKRITVNLAPSDIVKDGNHYDLPIALAVLCAMEIIPQQSIENAIIMGELSLDGRINYVNGALPAALIALEKGLSVICPEVNGPEVAFVGQDLEIIATPTILGLINHLKNNTQIPAPKPNLISPDKEIKKDLSDVKGQYQAKRALEIAMAGGHNLIMIGAPGSGKSMLAERAIDLLPDLNPKEILEVSIIKSITGFLKETSLSTKAPFRSPHHSASVPSIVGGGRFAKPGEITLAHNGILFMDEFAEFPASVLESLRQPLETGEITIARAESHVTYPAKFQLIAAMNPCKCGYFGDTKRECIQAPACAEKYISKISGPIMERIDLQVYVQNNNDILNTSTKSEESSVSVAKRVLNARLVQKERYKDINISLNRDLLVRDLDTFCELDEDCKRLVSNAQAKFDFSMREYHKTLRVARTIADLDSSQSIKPHHLAESFSFRIRLFRGK